MVGIKKPKPCQCGRENGYVVISHGRIALAELCRLAESNAGIVSYQVWVEWVYRDKPIATAARAWDRLKVLASSVGLPMWLLDQASGIYYVVPLDAGDLDLLLRGVVIVPLLALVRDGNGHRGAKAVPA